MSSTVTTMANRLDLLDQATFDFDRVIDVTTLLQCVWVYNRAVDIDGLRRFHGHLQRGRLSRCIERSPLRFGRHRWISCGLLSDMEIASARPREEFDDWLNEQANVRLDCEQGPVWHLAVVPFTDGGAGVSFIIPHCLTDGIGLCEALADAASGRDDPVRWPAAASRRRWQALREDLRQTARDIPAIARGVAAALRLARHSLVRDRAETSLSALPVGADERTMLPTATIVVDVDEWEARAHSLGGTSNTLLVGFAARFAQRVRRVAADGTVAVGMPINERVADDTRANVYRNVAVTVNPAHATTDLREVRAAVKQALSRDQEVRDDTSAAMSIVPVLGLVPKRILRRGGGALIAVTTSNLGEVNPATSRPDGTEADCFAMRIQYPGMTKARVHRAGGVQFFLSGRGQRYISISITAYQPGCLESNECLRQHLSAVSNEFSLAAKNLGAPPADTSLAESPSSIDDLRA